MGNGIAAGELLPIRFASRSRAQLEQQAIGQLHGRTTRWGWEIRWSAPVQQARGSLARGSPNLTGVRRKRDNHSFYDRGIQYKCFVGLKAHLAAEGAVRQSHSTSQ